MSDTTSRLNLPYMEGIDAASDIDQGFQNLAEAVDDVAVSFSLGTFANRPVSTPGSPGIQGRFYYATDVGNSGRLYWDYGTGWITLANDGSIPIGVIWAYGGSTAPSDFLMCDGAPYSRTTYADLFAEIGTNFGPGDGSTTFNVPNSRQCFLLGKADSGTGSILGETGGEIDHQHKIISPVAARQSLLRAVNPNADPNYFDIDGTGPAEVVASPVTATAHEASTNSDLTSRHWIHSTKTNPPFQVVNYIIRAL